MTLKIRLTLLEEMLGTKAANKDVFADFIAGIGLMTGPKLNPTL
jgi:hypothetical protein